MTDSLALDILKNNLQILKQCQTWMERSYSQCQEIGIRDEYTPSDYDTLEALTGRYSRFSDILINKVFRSIDKVETEDGGSAIDVLNRAEKRGLIQSAILFKDMRRLRNEITHEYLQDDIRRNFQEVFQHVPELLKVALRVYDYCRQHYSLE